MKMDLARNRECASHENHIRNSSLWLLGALTQSRQSNVSEYPLENGVSPSRGFAD